MQRSATFAMIARRAGSHKVCPRMCSTEVFGLDMIDRKDHCVFSAILTGEMIAPEYFTATKIYFWMRAVDHSLKSDNRWDWKFLPGRPDRSTTIKDEGGFF